MTDHEQIMVCAVRYALGRRSYMVSDVNRYVLEHLPDMSDHCRHVMIDDIKQQERWGYGDWCDEAEWKFLIERLEEKPDDN